LGKFPVLAADEMEKNNSNRTEVLHIIGNDLRQQHEKIRHPPDIRYGI
jgi:hypothetical protein